LKCDEKEKVREKPFKPESPLVIVGEGFQDAGFICALLRHLKIENCDVTFPKKKRDRANGKDGMVEMAKLMVQVPSLKGIALIRDADDKPSKAFEDSCAAFETPYRAPEKPFVVEKNKKDLSSGVFLIPGNGRTGTLKHLLLEAVFANHKDLEKCVLNFEACSTNTASWADNKKAKMKMQSVIASFCEDDPGCSLGFIWHKGVDNPIDIGNPVFSELSDFLRAFSASGW
jgi:hypothetical protein